MKGLASKVLIVVGILLILASILWWAIAVNAMVKLPDDVDVHNRYQGEMTWYVDPLSGQPLPEGEERTAPLTIRQDIVAQAGEYDSSTGVLKETVSLETEGVSLPASDFVYVLDRKTMENVSDPRAYAWSADNQVDRSGSYYPYFTFDTSKDEKYSIWKNEIGQGLETEFVSEDDKQGISIYNFKLSCEDKKVSGRYLKSMGLPLELTLEEMKPALLAAGVDLDAFKALAARVMAPSDLQVLEKAFKTGVPVDYLWTMEQELSVDPKTGIPLDVYKDVESLSRKVDLTALADLAPILAKYADNPQLGPAIGKLTQLQAEAGKATKVFSYQVASTQESIDAAVDESKKAAGRINLVKVYIPWALLIVGALVLIVGLLIGGEPVPEQEEEEEKQA